MISRKSIFSKILLFVSLSAFSVVGKAAAADSLQVDENRAGQQLEKLRREISEFEKRISKSQNREKDLLSDLEDFDREIALRRELVANLERERKKAQRSLETTQNELEALQGKVNKNRRDSIRTAEERDSLAALVSRRAVYSYKHFKRDVLKAVLMSYSLVQMLTRQEYIRRISQADRNNLSNLVQKNQKLVQFGNKLAASKSEKDIRLQRFKKTAQYKKKLIEEENSETDLLKKRRLQRESLLKRIRNDQDLLRRQLTDKKLAAQRIENLIKNLEARRKEITARPEVTWTPETPFNQLKGKLNWPTLGRVIAKFGLQRNRKLDTVTENPGIEIESNEGTPVVSVCSGQVTRITWLRGYGNTVIVDHRDGFYTVYAHLGQITVREGQVITEGEMIGRVGQTGSLNGPRLHFEIWAKRQKQDPLGWLTPK